MDKGRLEWVMSGLNRYALTTAEDVFLKTVSTEFDKNQSLTEHQEKRLEKLYKEKSRRLPNKTSDYYTFKKSTPKKTKPRMPREKVF